MNVKEFWDGKQSCGDVTELQEGDAAVMLPLRTVRQGLHQYGAP